jgi:hypothetical protein
MTREAGFKRRVRARMEKTGEAYSSARAHLEGGAAPDVIHVTNGDSVSLTLRQAAVPGRILAWVEMLHDGPVPAVEPAELHRIRAEHVARRGWGDAARTERWSAEREHLLASHAGRYLLWFEADLFDQLLLLQVLDVLRRAGVDPARATLVSVGEYRGIAHFAGLGELSAEQLAPLAEEGVPLTREATDLAAAAWIAFRSPDPRGLVEIVRARSPELRFLGEAFGRLLQEYPSRVDGLSLTQRRVLIAAASGPPAGDVFREISRREARPFLSDTAFFVCLSQLAECEVPLLETEGGVRLTEAGREVLAGRADHVRLSGIDRWIGGVHLTSRAPAWRYDERLETLVAV